MICTINMGALESVLTDHGWEDDIAWAENCKPPDNADNFAREVIFVICNSGMKFTVARGIYDRVMAHLDAGQSASNGFGHKGKTGAIDTVWSARHQLFNQYFMADDKLTWLETLPWIGKITKYHLAKNFGMQVAKPDVHLQRLADTFETTPQALCEELSASSGYKVATVDVMLWRAAAIGVLDTRTGKLRP